MMCKKSQNAMSPWDEAEAKDDAKTAQKLLERGLKKPLKCSCGLG